MPLAPVSAVWRGSRSIDLILSAMSWARGSLGLPSIDWSAVTMQALSANADNRRTSVPATPERRRTSGCTTSNKIRLPRLWLTKSPAAQELAFDYVVGTNQNKGLRSDAKSGG